MYVVISGELIEVGEGMGGVGCEIGKDGGG